ncbi:MAG: hypothetical protein K6C09_08400 [Oscillospiraceae bacterium]|nr:hypothetical protein [Oscillospiraceae bacterium]
MEDNRVFDWDDTIEDDGEERRFVLLPEGDYDFMVTDLQKKFYNGSQKLPACPEADLTLAITGDDGVAAVPVRLFLCGSQEWKLSSFFRCIGLKKHGEKLVMKWDKVKGAMGRCHVSVREWQGNDGQMRQSNEVQYFIDPEDEEAEFSL